MVGSHSPTPWKFDSSPLNIYPWKFRDSELGKHRNLRGELLVLGRVNQEIHPNPKIFLVSTFFKHFWLVNGSVCCVVETRYIGDKLMPPFIGNSSNSEIKPYVIGLMSV